MKLLLPRLSARNHLLSAESKLRKLQNAQHHSKNTDSEMTPAQHQIRIPTCPLLPKNLAHTSFRQLLAISCLVSVLSACTAAQRSLAIKLDETPLYPNKQWAVVNIPYIKVNATPSYSSDSTLLTTLRLGNIVELQRVEKETQGSTVWAYVISDASYMKEAAHSFQSKNTLRGQQNGQQNEQQNENIDGWVPYDFLHMVDNFKEAQLASRQILKTISQKNRVGSSTNLSNAPTSKSTRTNAP